VRTKPAPRTGSIMPRVRARQTGRGHTSRNIVRAPSTARQATARQAPARDSAAMSPQRKGLQGEGPAAVLAGPRDVAPPREAPADRDNGLRERPGRDVGGGGHRRHSARAARATP
jgi:hypothetical protein